MSPNTGSLSVKMFLRSHLFNSTPSINIILDTHGLPAAYDVTGPILRSCSNIQQITETVGN